MGFRFRKSFKIAPGVRATLTHRGLSTSVGTKGLRVSHARRGTHLTASAPGTGLSYQTRLGGTKRRARPVVVETATLAAAPRKRRWWLA